MKDSDIEINEIEIVEEEYENKKEITKHTETMISTLLKKNNELLEYHNRILIEEKKMNNLNIKVNVAFKLILIPAIVVFCLFLYKIYEQALVSNTKETTIVNNLPQQATPVVNVSVPTPSVEFTNQTILDKVSFYRGGYHGYVYRNTSEDIVYCRTDTRKDVYDIVISPNSSLELTYELYSCKDVELIEIRNPSAPKNTAQQSLFKI
ncbi:MAG: hypothetical protein H8E76_07210 [Helicobacteraceae bacterium]|nr:hypothetical protein [Candidatus Sulfurimonas ponti]MBC8238004.1 hypothetical protein [Candidatus Sulfurimonas ponti]MBL6973998.1 hypothetical protein [Sulfurimonas sp.]